MLLKAGSFALFCVLLSGCGSGVSTWGVSASGPMPDGFPRQLTAFAGSTVAFGLDGKPWDQYGIGGPSNVLYLNGNYWICVSGYPSVGFTAQAIGCWYGSDPTALKPYPGNPVLVNTHPAWAAACIEGPDLNTDGVNIYVSYLGFSANCDGLGTGSIGISVTSVKDFPARLSALPAVPQIPQPKELKWLYRPFITEINGICYDYSNAGAGDPTQYVLASFKTTGPCASTESDPANWKFNRIELYNTPGTWEGSSELQDPQVWQVRNGLWVMVFGADRTGLGGYAYTSDPGSGPWIKLDTNPFSQPGFLWLPRVAQDSNGQYWMFGNFNNTTQMNLWKAIGQ